MENVVESIQPSFIDRLLEQSPVIIVLVIICYILYRFILQLLRTIKQKDDILIELLDKQNNSYVGVAVSNEKLTNAVNNLTEEIKRHYK